jgi:hypothetical protein
MPDDQDELQGNGEADEEIMDADADPENDAVLHEKENPTSPRENI